MKGADVRKSFVEYFQKQGHTHVPSSRLIPEGDDTLLFANAGMNQFKNVFTGVEKRPYTRAVTSQKCVRAGGKHNDLENVGHTARHHTFFEMLGNFSFGDYFKKESIHYGWELCTKVWNIPKDRLYVTVFREDDEAADIWHKQEGIPRDRISRFDEKDNFWTMGDVGPCGPCSEIFFDYGPGTGCGKPDCKVGCSCDRYVEIWNHVFMQFEQTADGKRTLLPKPSVDTGAGLERVTSVLQGKTNNYDTDLFAPLIAAGLSRKTNKDLKRDDELAALRVLADHARSTAFLIADGALPSNEGRGYVLRRIMRRGIRYGRKLHDGESLLLPVAKSVIASFSDVYPELKQQAALIEKTVKMEEDRFLQTLDQGTQILNEEIKRVKGRGMKVIGGDVLFKLYDTFGFPVDLTNVVAQENDLAVDEKGFEAIMEKSKEHARTTWKGKAANADAAHLIQASQKVPPTKFMGYDGTEGSGKILLVSDGQKEAASLAKGQTGFVLLDSTCFYAEGGGQVGDKGTLKTESGEARVVDTTKSGEAYVHHVEVMSGEVKNGQLVKLQVQNSERRATARNHSATHLMHAALKKVLGAHVNQAGSLVNSERTRFDFTHSGPLTGEEIDRIETEVNREISHAHQVGVSVSGYQDAIKQGVTALFGEKYGDKVRVVKMGEYSAELCGGTHVHNTSDIRVFKITSESGVSAGVRRIEAITGDGAVDYLMKQTQNAEIARHAAGGDVLDWIEKAKNEIKRLEKEIKNLKGGAVSVDDLMSRAMTIPGGKFVTANLEEDDRQVLSDVADKLKNKVGSGVVLVVGRGDGSVPIIVAVTKDLTGQYNAGKILNEVASEMNGRGGGRPDFAQGAGKDAGKIPQALARAAVFLGAAQ